MGIVRKALNNGAALSKSDQDRSSSREENQSGLGYRKATSESDSEENFYNDDGTQPVRLEVVARVSTHALREERAYHICKNLIRNVDPHGHHIVRPVEIARLPSQQGDKGPIVVSIYEYPGNNYLPRVIDYGPAWYRCHKIGGRLEACREDFVPQGMVPLQTFMDFAVAATEVSRWGYILFHL